MLEGFDVVQAWLHQKELPVSWQLSQREERVGCFLDWLATVTDCESSAVVNATGNVLASVNASDSMLSSINEKMQSWQRVAQEDGQILHWKWLGAGDEQQGFAFTSSIELDEEFLQPLTEMLKALN